MTYPICRCCGRDVATFDNAPICTRCIPKHWGKHARGVNASRCKEYGGAIRDATRAGYRNFHACRRTPKRITTIEDRAVEYVINAIDHYGDTEGAVHDCYADEGAPRPSDDTVDGILLRAMDRWNQFRRDAGVPNA